MKQSVPLLPSSPQPQPQSPSRGWCKTAGVVLGVLCAGIVCAGAVLAAVLATRSGSEKEELMRAWKQLDFAWPSTEDREKWLAVDGPRSCMLAGVKFDAASTLYVSVPRWKAHVPATLARVVEARGGGAVLDPFPSWDLNREGDPQALQSVLGFEVDPLQRMWILDQGKVNGAAALPGAIKLVVWDLAKNSSVAVHRFADDVASSQNSFLNDVVVDVKRGFAFITDSGLPVDSTDNATHGALIVFDLAHNTSRRVLNEHASVVHNPAFWLHINGRAVNPTAPMRTGADGIALSPDGEMLFWCPLTSHALYSIDTALLRNFSTPLETIAGAVKTVCVDRGFASDGLAMDQVGTLFATSLEGSGLQALHNASSSSSSNSCAFVPLSVQDSKLMQWPDTLAFDHSGGLAFVSNRLHLFVSDSIEWDDTNFRIWKTHTGTDSYMAQV